MYLSPILDAFGRYIVGYDISKSPNLLQMKNMLSQAFVEGVDYSSLIIHSDQGWQYQHQYYQDTLKNFGARQSMSRKGNSLDNGLMECFFGLIKSEMFYGKEHNYKSVDDLIIAIHEYIDYYNNKRIKEKFDGLTPSEFRNQFLLTA